MFSKPPTSGERVNQIERPIAAKKWRILPEKSLQVLPDAEVTAGNQ